MKVINRSAITIVHKKPYVEWNNLLLPEMPISENTIGESSTYLIENFFDNAEAVIKKHYKEIFENELFQVWTDENDWPENISLKLFYEWFTVEVSGWVYDLNKTNLETSEHDL